MATKVMVRQFASHKIVIRIKREYWQKFLVY
jgi:hypothetical protein